MKIALISDIHGNIDALEAVLNDACTQGVEMYAFLGDYIFDMPFANDVVRRIRALPDPQLSHIPILAVTANAFAEDRQAALEAGMDGHLAKPVCVQALELAIARLLSRRSGDTDTDPDSKEAPEQ